MTCDINVPTLGSNIRRLLVFYENKPLFMGISKIWDSLNPTTLKGLISNIKYR
jgi:hypothetical protein